MIPIPVLEELDRFQKGGQIINDHARHFVRQFDDLSADHLVCGGIPLGEGKGRTPCASTGNSGTG